MSADQELFPRALSLAVHELRTPVTVVAGYLRMLLREQAGPLTEKQQKMLSEADRSCARLSALVSEISELGKLEGRELALAHQDFDVSELLVEVSRGLHEGEDRGVRLELQGIEHPAIVTGDRPRIARALQALAHSALRERGTPGSVLVACSHATGHDGRRYVVVAMGEAALTPSLAERARGTPPAFDEWRGGMGMALPVARRIIEAHGGALWSAEGAASRAASALRLPLRT